MSRKLDFIVFGVPRSGTTAVTRYINCVPTIHCGIEGFGYRHDHAIIRAPEAFFDNPFFPNNEDSLKKSRKDIQRKEGKIEYYGNKLPKYFYRLQGVLDEIEHPRAILCYRDVEKAALSYTSRAHREGPWPRGHTGIYAVFDMMLQLHALSRVRNAEIIVVPHEALVKDWQATMTRAIEFILPGISFEFDMARVEATEERKTVEANMPRADLSPTDREAIAAIDGPGISQVLSRDEAYPLAEVADRIPGLVARLPQRMLAFANALMEKHEDPKTRDYYTRWLGRGRPAWRDVKGKTKAPAA